MPIGAHHANARLSVARARREIDVEPRLPDGCAQMEHPEDRDRLALVDHLEGLEAEELEIRRERIPPARAREGSRGLEEVIRGVAAGGRSRDRNQLRRDREDQQWPREAREQPCDRGAPRLASVPVCGRKQKQPEHTRSRAGCRRTRTARAEPEREQHREAPCELAREARTAAARAFELHREADSEEQREQREELAANQELAERRQAAVDAEGIEGRLLGGGTGTRTPRSPERGRRRSRAAQSRGARRAPRRARSRRSVRRASRRHGAKAPRTAARSSRSHACARLLARTPRLLAREQMAVRRRPQEHRADQDDERLGARVATQGARAHSSREPVADERHEPAGRPPRVVARTETAKLASASPVDISQCMRRRATGGRSNR